MNYLSILIYLLVLITIAHSYIFSVRLSKFIFEPLSKKPSKIHYVNYIENIRLIRINGIKFLFATIFLFAPLCIYRAIFSFNIENQIILSVLIIIIILTSIVLLWLNTFKIGNSNFGQMDIIPKLDKITMEQPHLNLEFLETKTISQKINAGDTTSTTYKRETSKTRKSYKKSLLKKQNLELLKKFLKQLQNFKHFNKHINQFESLNINIGPNQNRNLNQENICYAILTFFLYEVCTNRDFIDTTPQIFYEPFNHIIFNNNEVLKRFNYPKFKQKYINDTGLEHFKKSEFYKELLLHYKNTPKM